MLAQLLPCDNEEDLLDQQTNVLKSNIGLNESNNMTRKRICDTLQTIFSTNSSPVSLHIFGSSINGLGMKGCDLDVYVDLPGNLSLYLH